MPSHSELPNELNRDKFTKVLESLGFIINKKGGKGSHYKATYLNNGKVIIIQSKLKKYVLSYVLKEIEKHTKITWEDIKDKL